MALNKLLMRASAPDYSFAYTTGLKVSPLEGGFPRMRVDIQNNVAPTNVSWNTGSIGYEYLAQAYRWFEKNAGHFLIDLIVDHGAIQEVEAQFVPGSFALSSQSGLLFSVSAQLYVYPNPGANADWPTEADYQSVLLQESGGNLLL